METIYQLEIRGGRFYRTNTFSRMSYEIMEATYHRLMKKAHGVRRRTNQATIHGYLYTTDYFIAEKDCV